MPPQEMGVGGMIGELAAALWSVDEVFSSHYVVSAAMCTVSFFAHQCRQCNSRL